MSELHEDKGFNLAYLWLWVDESVKDKSVFFGKTILLNRDLILSKANGGALFDKSKDVRVDSCVIYGLPSKNGDFKEFYEEMKKEGKMYLVLDDYISEL